MPPTFLQSLFVSNILGGLFAEDLLYTVMPDGDPVTIGAVVDRDVLSIDYSVEGETQTKTAHVTISTLSDYGIATPALGDKVTIDSTDWLVCDIQLEPIDGTAVLTIKRQVVSERSRDNYRVQK